MDLNGSPSFMRCQRVSNWPADVPFLFVPADEGRGSRLANYGNMGPQTLGVANKKTQWRSDGWFTTNDTDLDGEAAWPTESPEGASLLDALYFYRDCTAGSPGVGGNILLVSFRIGNCSDPLAQSRIATFGVSGNNLNAAAWSLISYLDTGELAFFTRDGVTETASEHFLVVGDDNDKHHITLMFDALNGAFYVWHEGVAVTLTPEAEASVVDLFVQQASATVWDTNAVTLTLGNTNLYGSPAGERTLEPTGLKNLRGAPLGDFFIADVTARDAVLAARRDQIAAALYASSRGYLSETLSGLLSA